MIEVKTTEDRPSTNFQIFTKHFGNITKIQLVKDLKKEKTYSNGTEIRMAHQWLSELNLEASLK